MDATPLASEQVQVGIAAIFIAIRSAESIIGKLMFHKGNAKAIFKDIQRQMQHQHEEMTELIDEQRKTLSAMEINSMHEQKLFERVDRTLESLSYSVKELSLIMKSFVRNKHGKDE
jgi:hypothetical protein